MPRAAVAMRIGSKQWSAFAVALQCTIDEAAMWSARGGHATCRELLRSAVTLADWSMTSRQEIRSAWKCARAHAHADRARQMLGAA